MIKFTEPIFFLILVPTTSYWKSRKLIKHDINKYILSLQCRSLIQNYPVVHINLNSTIFSLKGVIFVEIKNKNMYLNK